MRSLSLRATALVLALFVHGAPADAQTSFRDHESRFNIDIPQGWTRVSQSVLEAFAISAPKGGRVASLAGYVQRGSELKPPFIIIERRTQAFDLAGMTHATLARELGLTPYSELEKSGQYDSRGRYRGDNLSAATLVRGNTIVLVQGNTTVADGSPVYLYSAGFLGRHEIVRVSVFAPVDSADSLAKPFEQLMDTGQFDPGAAFEGKGKPFDWRSIKKRGGPLAWIGAGIGLVVYLARRRWAAD